MTSHSIPAASRILVVDDALSIHDDFRKILGRHRAPSPALLAAQARLFGPIAPSRFAIEFDVDCVPQGQEGLVKVQQALAADRPYAIAFIDMRMPPGWDGIETTRRLWDVDPALQVVICTAYSDRTWEDTVAQLGTTDNLLILKKPFDNIEVLQLAHALSTKWAIARRDRERLMDLDERVRKRTLELREAEGRFTKIFQVNPVATALQTVPEGRYVDANPAYLQLVGHERDDLVQRTCTDLDLWPDAAVWRTILDSLTRHEPLRFHQTRLRTKEGAIRDVLVSVEGVHLGTHACVLTSLEDITERLLLEQKFQQAQKMEAVGQLAAGVAHDFNNLLTVIQSYTAVMLDDRHLHVDHRDALGQVRAAADRAAALTRQLLVFTRRQITRRAPLNVGATVTHMREMLRRLVPEHIELEWKCAENLPNILGDEANLEQVVMNLVVNARDAMPDGGRLTFTVIPVTLDSAAAGRHPDARPGRYVQLSVADTGSGMSPAVLAHIFEPFFTTKGVGKGTGLGLSTVYAIVRQHAGWIEVTSTPGNGSRFDLFLPAAPETEPAAKPGPDGAAVPATLVGHGERILLVEDEESVRLAAATIATRSGYRVTEAENAPAALEAWKSAPAPFDVLLTDMVMPNGNGTELATELRNRNPRLKVIVMTGYSRDLLLEKARPPSGSRLLLKPFSAIDLLTTIRKTLDGVE